MAANHLGCIHLTVDMLLAESGSKEAAKVIVLNCELFKLLSIGLSLHNKVLCFRSCYEIILARVVLRTAVGVATEFLSSQSSDVHTSC